MIPPGSKTWKTGVVLEDFGNNSFQVQLEDGREFRRKRVDLRLIKDEYYEAAKEAFDEEAVVEYKDSVENTDDVYEHRDEGSEEEFFSEEEEEEENGDQENQNNDAAHQTDERGSPNRLREEKRKPDFVYE